MSTTQSRRCGRYAWCRLPGIHDEHVSRVHRVPAFGGREVTAFIAAEQESPPAVIVEVRFTQSGPLLPVFEMEPIDAVALADVLRALGTTARPDLRT